MISSYVGCWYCGVCVCEFSSGEAVVDLDPSVMTCAGGPRSEVGGSVGHVIRALPDMGPYVVHRRGNLSGKSCKKVHYVRHGILRAFKRTYSLKRPWSQPNVDLFYCNYRVVTGVALLEIT